MVSSVAVLSDIHGVLPALEAVLREPEVFADLQAKSKRSCAATPHMPFVRLVDLRLVVNPGSIGMPYGRSGDHWALLQYGDVSMRRTEVDVEGRDSQRRGRI